MVHAVGFAVMLGTYYPKLVWVLWPFAGLAALSRVRGAALPDRRAGGRAYRSGIGSVDPAVVLSSRASVRSVQTRRFLVCW